MTAPTPAQRVAEMKKGADREQTTKPAPTDAIKSTAKEQKTMFKTNPHTTAELRQSEPHTIADLKIPAWITESLTAAQLDQVAGPILNKLNAKRVDPQFAKLNAERNALHLLHYVRNVLPNLDHTVPDWCTEPHPWRYHEATGTATRYLGIAITGSTTTGVSAEASATQHDDGTLDFTIMIDCDPKATPADLRQFAADLMKLADEYEAAQTKAGRDCQQAKDE